MSTVMTAPVSSHQSSAIETEAVGTNRSARNWAIGLLVFEVVFLGTLTAYLLASIAWYQNCL